MAAPVCQPDAARQQLERVLASAGFSRNERLSSFLRFVVDQHLQGKDDEIKESVIAVEVFDRGPDHNPKQDSIVRTEAARLRARLGEYYLGEGSNDTVLIELPKGRYAPVFRQRQAVAPPAAAPHPAPQRNGRRAFVLAAAGVLLALGAVSWWWVQFRPNSMYLRARAGSVERGFRGINGHIGLLEDVVNKYPSFAPAYADLAAAYALRSGEFQFNMANEMIKMRAAAEKAIQLDPFLAQAHNAKGVILARDAQWQKAEESFRRAFQLDPDRPEFHSDFAWFFLCALGRTGEAVREMQVVQKGNSLSTLDRERLSYILISAGRFDQAIDNCDKLAESSPLPRLCQARARLGQGNIAQAIEILESAVSRGVESGSQIRGELGYAYALAGRREDAERVAASLPAVNPFNAAFVFAGLGDKDRTLEALDRAAAGGPLHIGWMLTSPEFALLQGDARVKSLRRKVGLPD